MSDWTEDHAKAMHYATEHPRDPGAPPHWMRCDYFCGEQRCIKGASHPGDHDAPTVPRGTNSRSNTTPSNSGELTP